MDKSATTRADGQCVIYSFGIGFNAGFDLDVAKRMPWCELFMFDPTPAVVTVLSGDKADWSALHADLRSKRPTTARMVERLRAQTRGLLANGTATPTPGVLSRPNVRFLPLGLAARDRNATMPTSWWTLQSRAAAAPRRVSFHSLKTVVAQVGSRPSVIKLDIEGAEKEPGLLRALLHSGAAQLLLELHGVGGSRLLAPDLLAAAAAAGYLPWRDEKASFASSNSIHYLVKTDIRA